MTRNFEPVTSRGRYEDARSHARIEDGADLRQSRINASTAVTIFGGLGEADFDPSAVWSAKSPNGTAEPNRMRPTLFLLRLITSVIITP